MWSLVSRSWSLVVTLTLLEVTRDLLVATRALLVVTGGHFSIYKMKLIVFEKSQDFRLCFASML